jgi:hypothetical protein
VYISNHMPCHVSKNIQFTKGSLEPKTCFGHNKSVSTQNQMKFKGFVYSVEGYKNSSEVHRLILLKFSKKHKLMVFKDLDRAQ